MSLSLYPRMLCQVFWSQVEYKIVCFISFIHTLDTLPNFLSFGKCKVMFRPRLLANMFERRNLNVVSTLFFTLRMTDCVKLLHEISNLSHRALFINSIKLLSLRNRKEGMHVLFHLRLTSCFSYQRF